MSVLWFDCASGISGDMTLGALLDLGVPLPVLQSAVDAVVPGRVRLGSGRVTRAGIAAVHALVDAPEEATHRRWDDVRALLAGADLAAGVRGRALAVFAALAEAEGRVHGVAPDEVHFHEVGALDAIADVVGTAAGLEHLGVTSAVASTVSLGGGTVRAAHGRLPVPGPAVVALLAGAPTAGGPVERELTTPTGAAILAATVTGWGLQPPMRVRAQGFGAGTADPPGHPNVLRLVLGEPIPTAATTPATAPATPPGASSLPARADVHGGGRGPAVLVEATVDDLDPRVWPGVVAALLSVGAHDAWLTAALGKKGRPVQVLTVLADEACLGAVRDVVFTATSTIGLRETAVAKTALERRGAEVTVAGQPVRLKLAVRGGLVVNVSAEWEDVAAAAAVSGRPAKALLAQAVAAGWALADEGPDAPEPAGREPTGPAGRAAEIDRPERSTPRAG